MSEKSCAKMLFTAGWQKGRGEGREKGSREWSLQGEPRLSAAEKYATLWGLP